MDYDLDKADTIDWLFFCWVFGLDQFDQMNNRLVNSAFIDIDGIVVFQNDSGGYFTLSENAPSALSGKRSSCTKYHCCPALNADL